MLRHEKDYDPRFGVIVFRGWIATESIDFITDLGTNYKKNVALLKHSMEKYGFIGGYSRVRRHRSLILIIEANGRRWIQEGGHRLSAARKSGTDRVYVTVYSKNARLHRDFWQV
tara:strand:+ start:1156 stop:1497 length:342 start_codon:yes stop_codon:yes gene_type:complete